MTSWQTTPTIRSPCCCLALWWSMEAGSWQPALNGDSGMQSWDTFIGACPAQHVFIIEVVELLPLADWVVLDMKVSSSVHAHRGEVSGLFWVTLSCAARLLPMLLGDFKGFRGADVSRCICALVSSLASIFCPSQSLRFKSDCAEICFAAVFSLASHLS
jgi:hypothetical protein